MTPAIKLVQQLGINHTVHRYEHDASEASYGLEAATKLGVDQQQVFKTLVTQSQTNSLAVAVVPVDRQLSLKLLAKALGVKKVVMAPGDLVVRSTGYILGGVSPLAQKQSLTTVIDDSAMRHSTLFVSAGQRGLEIEIAPTDLINLAKATVARIRSNDSA